MKEKYKINAVIKRSEKIIKTKQPSRFDELFHDLCVKKLATIIKDTLPILCLMTLFFQTGLLDLSICIAELQDIGIVSCQPLSDYHNFFMYNSFLSVFFYICMYLFGAIDKMCCIFAHCGTQ